jgi:predicted site-specific integrase-resolvase
MIMNNKYNELLTYSEYAKLKGISLKTVYNHVKAGIIKPVIIGKAKFLRYENNK